MNKLKIAIVAFFLQTFCSNINLLVTREPVDMIPMTNDKELVQIEHKGNDKIECSVYDNVNKEWSVFDIPKNKEKNECSPLINQSPTGEFVGYSMEPYEFKNANNNISHVYYLFKMPS